MLSVIQAIVSNDWIMNWEGCGRKQTWLSLRYYPSICLTEINHEKPQSGQSMSLARFEPGTFEI
jgi:hypothetical protein